MADGGFAGFGLLLCLFAAGLGRSFWLDRSGRRGALLLAVVGVAVGLPAVFPTDPGIRHNTLHGGLHDVAFVAVVLAFPAACRQFGDAFQRDPLWWQMADYTRATSAAVPGVWVIWALFADRQPYDPTPALVDDAGLIERGLILAITVWIAVVAIHHTRLAIEARARARLGDAEAPASR